MRVSWVRHSVICSSNLGYHFLGYGLCSTVGALSSNEGTSCLIPPFREFFKVKFRTIIEERKMARRARTLSKDPSIHLPPRPWWKRLLCLGAEDLTGPPRHDSREAGDAHPKLRTDMIRRMDEAPKLVNPSGWISERQTDPPLQQPPSALRSPTTNPQPQSPQHQVMFTSTGADGSIPSVTDTTDSVLDQEFRDIDTQKRDAAEK